jgi:hypothetical protein
MKFMYQRQALPSSTRPDQVYLDKLRSNIAELQQSQDEESRDKIGLLTAQLDKLEESSATQVLTNSLTVWQTSLARDIRSNLKSLGDLNVLTSSYHKLMITIIESVPQSFSDSLIRSILVTLPHDLSTRSPYGWDFFVRNIQDYNSLPADVVEMVVYLFYPRNQFLIMQCLTCCVTLFPPSTLNYSDSKHSTQSSVTCLASSA